MKNARTTIQRLKSLSQRRELAKHLPALFLALLLGSAPAWASLGDSVASVHSDSARMRGEVSTAAMEGYTIHLIDSPDGTQIREYVSPSGLVFGVAWQGPFMPNLSQLLGTYFAQFQQAAASSPARRRRALAVHTGALVVESGGHMRGFHGRAYLTTLMPANLSPAVVQ
jgi:hypothetical protein